MNGKCEVCKVNDATRHMLGTALCDSKECWDTEYAAVVGVPKDWDNMRDNAVRNAHLDNAGDGFWK